MKTTTQSKIEKVKTLKDLLIILESDFDTQNCKPSRFIKTTLIYTLIGKLGAVNALLVQNVKVKATESENMSDFIKIVKQNFNCEQEFTSVSNLVNEVESLTKLIGLKEHEEVKEVIRKKK